MKEPRTWTVDDLIRIKAHRGGYRVWRVTHVQLGGEAQESLVGLETLDMLVNGLGPINIPVELLDVMMTGGVVEVLPARPN